VNVLVIGGGGLLGNELSNYFQSRNCSVSKFYCNIQNRDSILDIQLPEGFDLIVNCSGLVGVEKCQSDPHLAKLLNTEFPGKLAMESLRLSTRFVHFSTPSVFSGKSAPNLEMDLPDSISVYGITKAHGDNLVLRNNPSATVLRVNFVAFSNSKPTLANAVLAAALRNDSFEAFDDVHFNPVEIGILGAIVLEAQSIRTAGLLHVGTDNIITKYFFAQQLYAALGVDPKKVLRVIESPISKDANFSSNTSLMNTQLRTLMPSIDLSEIDYPRLIGSSRDK
jgi:dTDP-4-dehydrorhamnose reductase